MLNKIFDTILLSDEVFQAFARELSETYPELIHLSKIGTSQEGRPIRLLTVTEFASGEDKPALFIQGTIHSKELSGTLVGLDIVKRLAEDHVPGGILSRAVFYIMPRCNPDGANRMAVQPGDERSSWGPATGVENGLERCSFTPDGCCKYMLVETPEGKLCFSDRHPLCLVDRTPESQGPFYNFMPEGTLSNFNRETLTDWPECAREYIDWNRNWPVGWCDGQYGCGSAPLSVPEVKMQAEWMAAHPNIRAAVALHNGYGSFLFPSPRPEDREYMEDLGRRGEALVGYPAYYGNSFVDVSCQVPPQGTFSDYCYFGLNILGLTLELGTRENSAGADTRELFFRKNAYSAPWEVVEQQDAHPELPRCIFDWQEIEHPQLGKVLVGGACPVLFANPLEKFLEKVSHGAYRFTLEIMEDILAGRGIGAATPAKP